MGYVIARWEFVVLRLKPLCSKLLTPLFNKLIENNCVLHNFSSDFLALQVDSNGVSLLRLNPCQSYISSTFLNLVSSLGVIVRSPRSIMDTNFCDTPNKVASSL